MKGVITILNSGTSYNSDKGDLVADLAEKHLASALEISLFNLN